ncbi:MAG TPA: TIGR03435 family protein [Acidobacteriaceae bacterium]
MNRMISRRDATRIFARTVCAATVLPVRAVFAQSIAPPQFEVSTVRPSGPESGQSSGIDTEYGRLEAKNVTLKRCIVGAYGVGPHQVVGGPDWVDSQTFDIAAKADQPVNDDAVLNQMLQALLADRFKLAMHRETKTLPAYVLEIDKQGPKMKAAAGGNSSTDTGGKNGSVTIRARNTDMDLLAQVVARKMDLPVVNQTGLKGAFDFKLHWTPDNVRPSSDTPDDVSIFTALREQLGLRLRSAKAPVEVLVIDHAERPSAN